MIDMNAEMGRVPSERMASVRRSLEETPDIRRAATACLNAPQNSAFISLGSWCGEVGWGGVYGGVPLVV